MSKQIKEYNIKGKEEVDLLPKATFNCVGVSLDHLLLYVLDIMEEKDIFLSFPNITIAGYRIFPGQFALFGWPHIPDSLRIHQTLWHMIDHKKKWLIGNKEQFLLTEKGRAEIKKAKTKLKAPATGRDRDKRREKRIIKLIEESKAFHKYQKGEEITEFEFYDFLQCTLASSFSTLRSNYMVLCINAEASGDIEIIEFLKGLKEKFKKELTHVEKPKKRCRAKAVRK